MRWYAGDSTVRPCASSAQVHPRESLRKHTHTELSHTLTHSCTHSHTHIHTINHPGNPISCGQRVSHPVALMGARNWAPREGGFGMGSRAAVLPPSPAGVPAGPHADRLQLGDVVRGVHVKGCGPQESARRKRPASPTCGVATVTTGTRPGYLYAHHVA